MRLRIITCMCACVCRCMLHVLLPLLIADTLLLVIFPLGQCLWGGQEVCHKLLIVLIHHTSVGEMGRKGRERRGERKGERGKGREGEERGGNRREGRGEREGGEGEGRGEGLEKREKMAVDELENERHPAIGYNACSTATIIHHSIDIL